MPTLRDYDWFHWIEYGPSTDCTPALPDSNKKSYTTATIGDTAAVQMLGSYNWWHAMGEPAIDEYVYHENACYQYKGYTYNTPAAAGIDYGNLTPGSTPSASATCTLCWSNAAGGTNYHTWEECGIGVNMLGLMTNSTISVNSNNTFHTNMGSPSQPGMITKVYTSATTWTCYEYLGTSTNSALPQLILQTANFTSWDAPSMYSSGECTLCTNGADEYHEWELCGASERINLVGVSQTNTAAYNQATWVLAANPSPGTVISFNGECYTYKASNSQPSANGFTTVTTTPISIHSSCNECTSPAVYGCTDPNASNYNPLATIDDGSCLTTFGCMDETASNYNPLATTDDGSCVPFVYGCTDPTASNYDPLANTDDGSCLVVQGGTGCTIAFGTEICQPDGTSSIDIDLSSGAGLLNVVTTVDGVTYGTPTGCATPPVTIPVTGLTEGQTISIQGECSYTKEDYDASSGAAAPNWAAPNCGESTQVISNETAVYVYYDGTSMGDVAAKNAYKSVMKWLIDLPDFDVDTVHGSSTQNVYHTAVAGERWLDWGSAALTGTFNNRQTIQAIEYKNSGGTMAGTWQVLDYWKGCTAGSDCSVKLDPTTLVWSNTPNTVTPSSRMHQINNWAHNTSTATQGGTTWDVHDFYDTAESSLIGEPFPVYNSSSQNGSQIYLGHPPAANATAQGNRDVLVIIFADESTFQYHSGSSPNFDSGGNTTHSGGASSYRNLDQQQPTPHWKDDYDEFKVQRTAHLGTGKSSSFFLYPSCPQSSSGSCSCSSGGGHKNFPLHALAGIHSGNNTPVDGMWQTGTSPANGCNSGGVGSALVEIETENPYWTSTTPTYGGLDNHGWGTNVDEQAFNDQVFVNDLTVFLGSGGTQEICDGSQCINIKAVDENGVPIANYPIKVNGVSAGSTNAAGIVTNTLTSAGAVVINDCFTFSAIGSCFQTLITIEIVKEDFLTALNCILGCTDPDSWNYNPLAGVDDGSCMYPLEEDPRDSMSRCELLKIDTECQFATDVYNLYKYQRYGLDKGCLYNMDGHATKKYTTDWTDNLLPDYGAETFNKVLHTKDATPKPDWVVTACGEQEDALTIYFYYDCTSLGQAAVTLARNANEEWVDGIRAERVISAANKAENNCTSKINDSTPYGCPPTASSTDEDDDNSITVYHTLVAGERWIDWGTSAMTGEFNNNGEFNSKYCGGYDSPSGQYLTNNGFIDAAIPNTTTNSHLWSTLIYDTPSRVWYNAGGNSYTCTTCTGQSGSTAYSGTLIGEAPLANTDNVLVVIFADESGVGNSASTPSKNYTWQGTATTPTWISAMNGASETCTTCYKNDYDKFISVYNNWKGASSDRNINFFLYPSYPANVSAPHRPFPLHVLGAISSGNQTVKDGTWTSAPANAIATLSAVTTSNPYYAETNSTTTHSGIDPNTTLARVNSGYGGLDQYSWGTNVAEVPFTAEDFATDLDEFWDSTVCNDTECLLITVVDKVTGKPIPEYPIVIDGLDAGNTNEFGILRTCISNASINTEHNINLCHCFNTTGACNQQKIEITVDGIDCDDCGNIKMF